ncbi:unnamed protein product [Caenorhabditis brenneri]
MEIPKESERTGTAAIDIGGARRGDRLDSDPANADMSYIASPSNNIGTSFVHLSPETGGGTTNGNVREAKATVHEDNCSFLNHQRQSMTVLEEESESQNMRISLTEVVMLPGEDRARLPCGTVEWPIVGGLIFLTNYRVVVALNNPDDTKRYLVFPLQEIEQVDFAPPEAINLQMKGGRVFRIMFPPEKNSDAPLIHKLINTAFQRLNRHITSLYLSKPQEWTSNGTDNPMQSLNVFAWKFSEAVDELEKKGELPSWLKRSDSIANEITHIDFNRLGMSEHFQITSVNEDFEVCPTYPEKIIIPKGITDDEVKTGAKYRSISRFPAVVWRCQKTRAVLLRSSQPQVGILAWRNSTDEKIIEEAVKASRIEGEEKKQFIIMDARGYTSAFANRARSGGFENTEYYQQAKLEFLGLPNIHTVRTAFAHVRSMLHSQVPTEQLLTTLQSTGWLSNLSSLLVQSANCADHLSKGHSVLVHCSDGWDRTTQVTTLAKIILDEHYRTIEGFEQLIRRDWIAFGHKLYDRQQIGVSGWGEGGERSPIFLQFLEAVRHLQREQPTLFQFSHAYLIKLAKHAYSGLFGTFIFNSHKERREATEKWNGTLVDIWRFIGAHNEEFVNQAYDEKYIGPMKPVNLSVIKLHVWHEVFADEGEGHTFQLIYNKEERPSSGCSTPMAASAAGNMVKSKSSESINSLNVDGSLKDNHQERFASACSPSTVSADTSLPMSTSFHQQSIHQCAVSGIAAIDSDGLIRFEDDVQAMLRKKNKAKEEAIRLRDQQIEELRKRAIMEKNLASPGQSLCHPESDTETTSTRLERAMSDLSMVDPEKELPNFRPNTTWETAATNCRLCDKEFVKMSVYTEDRQHHCRNCGRVVCEECSKHRYAVIEEGQSVQKRVCDICYESMHEPEGRINSDPNSTTIQSSSSTVNQNDPGSVNCSDNRENLDLAVSNVVLKTEEADGPIKEADGPIKEAGSPTKKNVSPKKALAKGLQKLKKTIFGKKKEFDVPVAQSPPPEHDLDL